jgi:hypothetical protein
MRTFGIAWIVVWSVVMLAVGMPFFTYIFIALLPWITAFVGWAIFIISMWLAVRSEQHGRSKPDQP